MKSIGGGVELNRESCAEFFGVDLRTVDIWLRRGLPATKEGRQWKINSATVARWRIEREREQVLGELANVSEDDARRRKLVAEAARAEFELARATGAAVAIADVEATVSGMIGAARAKLLGVGTKLARELAVEADVLVCRKLIDGGVHDALVELSEWDGSIPDNAAGSAESTGGGEASSEDLEPAAAVDGKPVGRRRQAAERGE